MRIESSFLNETLVCQVTVRYTCIVSQIYVHSRIRVLVHVNIHTDVHVNETQHVRGFTYAKGSRYCTAEIRWWGA